MEYFVSAFQEISRFSVIPNDLFMAHQNELGFPYLGSLYSNCFQVLSQGTGEISLEKYVNFISISQNESGQEACEVLFNFISGSENGITFKSFSKNSNAIQRLFRKLTGSISNLTEGYLLKVFKELDRSGSGVIEFKSFAELCVENLIYIEWNKFILFSGFRNRAKNTLGCYLDLVLGVLDFKEYSPGSEVFFEGSPKDLLKEDLYTVGKTLTWNEVRQEVISESSLKELSLSETIKNKLKNLNENEVYQWSWAKESGVFMSLGSTLYFLSALTQSINSGLNKIRAVTKESNKINSYQIVSHFSEEFQKIISDFKQDLLSEFHLEKYLKKCINLNFSIDFWDLSSGKSSSFFLSSWNKRYLIKSLNKEDIDLVSTMINSYTEYISQNPQSFLCKLLGVFTFKDFIAWKRNKFHFLLMEDLILDYSESDLVYDLKGSTLGRSNKSKPDKMNPLKDLDFFENKQKISVSELNKSSILAQLKKDCEFLESFSITDYSLVLRIQENKESASWKSVPSECGRYLYSFGIIDYFTVYSMKKKLEMFFKSKVYSKGFSCCPPNEYSQRLYKFIESIFT